MTAHGQLAFSLLLLMLGLLLMDPASCSHPMRLAPDCLDAPAKVECK